ncbi:hypothetical protein Glove_323g34 [Diversispora epigaea]|uniref:Uncharacterized protein n=1 Tax=Diversispora epigaea TaxID=1348612 RepID=A0A397HTC5_9GLOM|nr:hypothetical protein Glove_323g34 [Diversispora epigaea]
MNQTGTGTGTGRSDSVQTERSCSSHVFIKKDKPPSVTIWCLLAETQKEIIRLMVIAKRRNDCVDEAIKQKNEALSEIVEKELSREEKDPNYEVIYTLKDLN